MIKLNAFKVINSLNAHICHEVEVQIMHRRQVNEQVLKSSGICLWRGGEKNY